MTTNHNSKASITYERGMKTLEEYYAEDANKRGNKRRRMLRNGKRGSKMQMGGFVDGEFYNEGSNDMMNNPEAKMANLFNFTEKTGKNLK